MTCRVGQHVSWWAEHEALTRVEDEHLIAHREDRLHDVLDDDDRHALGLEVADELQRGLDLSGPQSGHDLVEQEQPRAERQRLGELQPPGVGHRELTRGPAGGGAETDLLQHLVGRCRAGDIRVIPSGRRSPRPRRSRGPSCPGRA
jgi:hypothetical protein